MRAVVDRETLAGLRGVNAARTSAAAWVLTMVLAGLGGILIAPLFAITGLRLHPGGAGFARRRGPRRAAIDPDRVRRRPAARRRAEPRRRLQRRHASRSSSATSAARSVGAVLPRAILLLIFARGRARRAGSVADDVPPPDHRVGLPKWRRRLPWAVWTFILIAFSLQWFSPDRAPGRRLRPDGHRPEPGHGDHLPVVRGRHRHGRHGEPRAGRASSPPGGFAAGWALHARLRRRHPGACSRTAQVNFLWAIVLGGRRRGRARRIASRHPAAEARRRQPRARHAGLGVLRSRSSCGRSTTYATAQAGWSIRSAHPRHPRVELGQRRPRAPAVARTRPSLKLEKLDFSQLPEQILLFLAVFGLLTLMVHALPALGHRAGPSSRCAARRWRPRPRRHRRQPGQVPDVRALGRHRRHRWRDARSVQLPGHRHHRAAARRVSSGSRSRSRSASAAPAARSSPGSRSPAAPRCSTGSRRTCPPAAT